MDGLLTEIKTVKKVQSNIEKFESLSLDDSSQARSNSTKSKRSIIEISSSNGTDSATELLDHQPPTRSSEIAKSSTAVVKRHKRQDSTAFLQKSYLDQKGPPSLPDDAREILKSQPDPEDLIAVLQYLQYGIQGKQDFNVHVPSPKAAQIINTLVTITLPDQWHLLRQSRLSKTSSLLKELLVLPFRSVAGIGALIMQIKTLGAKKDNRLLLEDMFSVLDNVLRSPQNLRSFLQDSHSLYTKGSQRRVYWQEVLALICGSKVLSATAQAFAMNTDTHLEQARWLTDGNEFSAWLATNISVCATGLSKADSESWTMLSQALKRAMSLGYREALISSLYDSLLLGPRALWTPLQQLLNGLSSSEQRVFFDGMLVDLVRKYLRKVSLQEQPHHKGLETDASISGVAAMISGLVQSNKVLEDHVEDWLTSTTSNYASLGLDTRRAVVATLGLHQEKLQKMLEKCLDNFGDKVQIQHSPILQQKANAEVILLLIGYLWRSEPEAVRRVSKSGLFFHCVSNRLSASVPRCRLLGMIMAVAVSRLVDDKVMDFGSEDMESESAKKMMVLVQTNDKVGDIKDLKAAPKVQDAPLVKKIPRLEKNAISKAPQPQASKIIAIEETEDSPEEEDDDLIPYPKPDADPSDSDDDPTLVSRTRPTPPVYIIDLVSALQKNESPETIDLALHNAPSLIRRKANFGTELSSNIQVLATTLLNLKDDISTSPELQSLRLQSLIACLVAKPAHVAPWLASMYFEGDFSLSQRAMILSTLGLGARELSGYNDNPSTTTSITTSTPLPSLFPSSLLPPHIAPLYTPTSTLANDLTHTTIQPLALAAADKLSGPDVIKIRTFSSRMEVQRKTQAKQAERSKRIPRDLHALLGEKFYLPLCLRLGLLLSSSSTMLRTSSAGRGAAATSGYALLDPILLRLFLQTLTILLHSLGPNALSSLLEAVTRETLTLLITLHNIPVLAYDPVILPAILQLLLTVLEVNVEAGASAEERLVREFGEGVAEMVRWCGGLEGSGIGIPLVGRGGLRSVRDGGVEDGGRDDGMGMPWTVLAAGIQVKWHEVGRKFQGTMLGLMSGEMDDF